MVAGTPKNQDIAGRINILHELQTAMHNFQDHAEVQKMSCGALWQLTLGHAMNKSKAGQQGMLQSLQVRLDKELFDTVVDKRTACFLMVIKLSMPIVTTISMLVVMDVMVVAVV